jgi:hypothetical protein
VPASGGGPARRGQVPVGGEQPKDVDEVVAKRRQRLAWEHTAAGWRRAASAAW